MTLYRKTKHSLRKLVELINQLGKVAGYKINIPKIVASLYANDEVTKREIKKKILFTIATHTKNQIFGINLTEVKDFYNENYQTLMKDIIKHTKNGMIFLAHGSEKYHQNVYTT